MQFIERPWTVLRECVNFRGCDREYIGSLLDLPKETSACIYEGEEMMVVAVEGSL